MTPSAGPEPRASTAWWVALAGLCLILIVPLLVGDVPPLLDYPNHLARIFVLASLPHDQVLAHFYAPNWSIIPNLALDLIGPQLIHLLPVYVAGRLLIAISVLLPVLGTVAYSAALSPAPASRWWSLGVGLVAFNDGLLYGFLNFSIALGLALLLAAAWLRWREQRPVPVIALSVAAGPVLFTCHLMGVLFFALLIGATELWRLEQAWGRHRNFMRGAISRGAILLLVFIAPATLYAFSALQQAGGDAEFFGPALKLLHLLFVLANYNRTLDLLTAELVIMVPVLAVMLRRGTFPGPARNAVLLFSIAYVVSPYAWKGTYGLDMRFAIMLVFMLFAGFVPRPLPQRLRLLAATTITVLFAVRMTLLTTVWASHQADIDDLRYVLAPVQPGQAVYVAAVSPQEAPSYWEANPRWRKLSNDIRLDKQLGALVLTERRAYWPFEFEFPSQQPIETREPYRTLSRRIGELPDRAQAAIADMCGFDYVLLTEADAAPELPPERFRLLQHSGFAALYTIENCNNP